jgi:hypothetical protein
MRPVRFLLIVLLASLMQTPSIASDCPRGCAAMMCCDPATQAGVASAHGCSQACLVAIIGAPLEMPAPSRTNRLFSNHASGLQTKHTKPDPPPPRRTPVTLLETNILTGETS